MEFREDYGHYLVREIPPEAPAPPPVPERVVSCIWYDRLIEEDGLTTDDGQALKILSPGWWNHGEGPDFKGAQIELAGRPFGGDVEIHLSHSDWRQHGHQRDARYNNVILAVALESVPPKSFPRTSEGRRIPTLSLQPFLGEDIRGISQRLPIDEYPYGSPCTPGKCSELGGPVGRDRVLDMLKLAGEWRMLNKARMLRDGMARAGGGQTVYEALLAACGYGPFKSNFRAVARHLPYDRARQLAREDPFLLEAALLQIAGLLPKNGEPGISHLERLQRLRAERLRGLKSLPLTWRHVGIRPCNYPERRLAGATRLLARTGAEGLSCVLEEIWRDDCSVIKRRRAFESLFGKAMGFWSNHCTWTGKKMKHPSPALGPGRIRSIIGNVFVPAALANARLEKDCMLEERVFDFFARLPKEPPNRIVRAMLPRMFGSDKPARLDFRMQQGLLQVYEDWCESNPSCRNCSFARHLRPYAGEPTALGPSRPP